MVGIDLVGLIVTILITGPLLAGQIVLAALVQELGRLIVALAAGGHVQSMMAGGVFGRTGVTGLSPAVPLLAGPFVLLLVGALSAGPSAWSQPAFWLPWARTDRPFAAACCRLAILSTIQCLWALIVRGTIP